MTKVTKLALIPPDAPKNEWGVPACPECGRFDFKARTALGLHRSQQHGIPGQSKSAKDARRLKPAVTPVEHNAHLTIKAIPPDTKKNKVGIPICPECGKDDFARLNELGNHRRKIHGIIGSTNRIAVTEDYNKTGSVCTFCQPPKSFKNNPGLAIHQSSAHGIKGTTHMSVAERKKLVAQSDITIHTPRKVKANGSISNGHSPEISRSTEPPLTAEDLLIFQTVGELKGHCRFVAESAGFPTAQFTARVILALHSQTRR